MHTLFLNVHEHLKYKKYPWLYKNLSLASSFLFPAVRDFFKVTLLIRFRPIGKLVGNGLCRF